ncbi:MAG: hypothetical protein P1U36_04575 [Legionellaceae bacterium]|nr:hypothetical protein [Legionellaceae bacterium]
MHSSEDHKMSQEQYISTLIDALATIDGIKQKPQNLPFASLKHDVNFLDNLARKRTELAQQDKQNKEFYDEALSEINALKKQGLSTFEYRLGEILKSEEYKIYQQTAENEPFVITAQDRAEEEARLAAEQETSSHIKENSTEVNAIESSSSTLYQTTEKKQEEVNTPVNSSAQETHYLVKDSGTSKSPKSTR